MNVTDLLAARLESVDASLASLTELLNARRLTAAADLTAPSNGRQERVRQIFEVEHDEIVRLVAAARTDLASGCHTDSWRSIVALESQITDLANEVVIFVTGALWRGAGLDGGYCTLVDALLEEVAGATNVAWDRLTVPATSDFSSGRTRLIGIRLFDRTIWSMPLAAHELGHFAADQLFFRRQRPVADTIATSPAPGDAGEHFADLYSAVALGPAFLATLVEQANPTNSQPSAAHPAWPARVYLVRRALDDRCATAPELSATVRHLVALWEQSCEAAGAPPWPCGEEQAKLDGLYARAEEALIRSTRATSLEASWREVERAAGELERGFPPTTRSLRVVVNAAWRARLRLDREGLASRVDAHDLDERATSWCWQLVTGHGR